MADTTYAVKVSDELKEKLQKLVDESGQSSKDFFADMVSQFELANAKKQAPILSADIDELVKLTTRINNIFINVGERVLNLQETYQLEAENQMKEKESLISLLQQQVESLKRDAVQTEDQVNALMADNETLRKEKIEAEKKYTSEIGQLKEMNLKNDEIISGHSEKINTLSGLINKYQVYADENETLKQKAVETQRAVEKLQQNNERLNTLLAEKERQIKNMQDGHGARLDEMTQKHSEDMERQKEKFELEKDRALLEQREQYNSELDDVRDMYQEKINQLLQIGSKPKRETKKKGEAVAEPKLDPQ